MLRQTDKRIKLFLYPDIKYSVAAKCIIAEFLNRIFEDAGNTIEQRDNILFCADELLINIIEHNKKIRQTDTVDLSVSAADSEIVLKIGAPDNSVIRLQDTDLAQFKTKFKGAGLHIIKNLATDFRYEHADKKNWFTISFKYNQKFPK